MPARRRVIGKSVTFLRHSQRVAIELAVGVFVMKEHDRMEAGGDRGKFANCVLVDDGCRDRLGQQIAVHGEVPGRREEAAADVAVIVTQANDEHA